MQVVHGDYHFIKVDLSTSYVKLGTSAMAKACFFCPNVPTRMLQTSSSNMRLPLLFSSTSQSMSCVTWWRLELMVAGTDCVLPHNPLAPSARYPGRQQLFVLKTVITTLSVRDLVAEIFRDVVGYAVEEQIEKVMAIAVPNFASQQNTTVLEQILLHFPQSRRPSCYLSQLTKDVQEKIEQVIDQYHPSVTSGKIDQIIWPMTLFSHWDPAGKYYRGPIELVGPQRYLIWGPYMHLPKGDWVATLDIEMTENYSGNQLVVDITAGFGTEVLAIGMLNLPVQGVFSFKISFRINEPSLPIEIRFFLKCGAIEGKFALRRAVIQPSCEAFMEQDSFEFAMA